MIRIVLPLYLRVLFAAVCFAVMGGWVGDSKAQGLEALANEAAPVYAPVETVVPSAELPVIEAAPVEVEQPMILEKEVISAQAEVQQQVVSSDRHDDAYVLGADDVIKVIVYGESDLTSSYKIGATGAIAFPLIGDVNVQGKTVKQVEALLKERLSDGYLVNPSVIVEVSTYRPFFILGEVRQPGSYDYSNGITVLKAVALAGGFTYRANKKKVQILTTKNKDSNLYEKVPVNTPIGPGDIILVKERFF